MRLIVDYYGLLACDTVITRPISLSFVIVNLTEHRRQGRNNTTLYLRCLRVLERDEGAARSYYNIRKCCRKDIHMTDGRPSREPMDLY